MKRITIAIAAVALAVPAAAQAASSSPSSAKAPLSASAVQRGEVRIVGTVTKLTSSKITVTNANRSRTFLIPAGFNLGGIQKGDRVQAEGEKRGGKLTLTSIHREDSAAAAASTYARHGSDDGPGHDKGDDKGHDGGGHR
jgi:hypothetical protein